MPTFVYPSLLWGLLIAAVPVLIHLINMMRHRRVRWAAMEFLLASQKKNRAWVLLKQLLLLLLRMAIVAGVVAAVAQPLLRSDLAGLLGRSKTHHIVLLDDSFSMSDRWADTSAMDRAKAVIQRIGTVAAQRSEQQAFTLLRFSRARRIGQGTQPERQLGSLGCRAVFAYHWAIPLCIALHVSSIHRAQLSPRQTCGHISPTSGSLL